MHTRPRKTRPGVSDSTKRFAPTSRVRPLTRCNPAPLCLWNQLPASVRQPRLTQRSLRLSRRLFLFFSPRSPSTTPSLFHFRLDSFLFHKSLLCLSSGNPGPYFLSQSVMVLVLFLYLACVLHVDSIHNVHRIFAKQEMKRDSGCRRKTDGFVALYCSVTFL